MAEYALGIDVGYSRTRRSTGLCLLSLAGNTLGWRCLNTGTDEETRIKDLQGLAPRGTRLVGVGIDGPLTCGLRVVSDYRTSNALLSREVFRLRGKPGQTSVPSGQRLHQHATLLARLVLKLEAWGHLSVAPNPLPDSVDEACLLEVFPNAFLAVLVPDDAFVSLGPLKRKASDRFWEVAVDCDLLARLLENLIPGVRLNGSLDELTDHDHRAAFICALAALAVARGRYVAVGDPVDGDIVLPPLEAWGLGSGGQPWAQPVLFENLAAVSIHKGGHRNHEKARLLRDGLPWR